MDALQRKLSEHTATVEKKVTELATLAGSGQGNPTLAATQRGLFLSMTRKQSDLLRALCKPLQQASVDANGSAIPGIFKEK